MRRSRRRGPEGPGDHRAPDILDRELEQREAEAGDEEAAQIEPRRRRCAEILDQPQRQHHAADADRQIEIKNRSPRKDRSSETRRRSAHGRPDHRRDRHPVHCRDEVRARKAAQQDQAADRRHHGAAKPCSTRMTSIIGRLVDNPHRADPAAKIAIAAQNTTRAAEAVGDPAADRDEDGEAQQVSGDHQIEPQRTFAEASWPCRGSRRRSSSNPVPP